MIVPGMGFSAALSRAIENLASQEIIRTAPPPTSRRVHPMGAADHIRRLHRLTQVNPDSGSPKAADAAASQLFFGGPTGSNAAA
jgi:hypothetical protein